MDKPVSKESLETIDDFVFVEYNLASEETIIKDNSEHKDRISNIAQCKANINNNSEELSRTVYNAEGTNVRSLSVLNRHVSIEEYWEQKENVTNNIKNKLKPQTSKRKTIKEHKVLDYNKTTPRHPSYYKFDDATTRILETLPIKMEPLTNIVGKGHNSVVIHAFCSYSNNIYFPSGLAIKVYKLGSDVAKNNAIIRKVKREEEHLAHVLKATRYSISKQPYVLYRSRNVIVQHFVGSDQETHPSINKATAEECLELYKTVVKDMDDWYNKAEVVHGNLSTKTIVGQVFYLGWSHSVRKQHPAALKKLMRDCHFVTTYFAGRGVPVKPTEKLFKEITGLDEISNRLLEVPHKKNLWKASHVTNPNRVITVANHKPGKDRFK